MITGYFRGHKIYWDEALFGWRYADDHSLHPGWGGEIRPCAKCGAVFGMHEPDPCLGVLPGVDNACCGHGIRTEAYVRFASHVVLRGFFRDKCCGAEEETIELGAR